MQPLTFRITCRERVRDRARNFAVGLSTALIVALPQIAAAGPPAGAGPGLFSGALGEGFRGLVSGDVIMMGWRLLLGLLLFVGGWLVAKLISSVVFRLLRRVDFDARFGARLGVDSLVPEYSRRPGEYALERGIARVVFWLLMALVIVGVLDFAQLQQAASPIQGFVATVVMALPRIGMAILILVVAYFIGALLQALVSRGLAAARCDARLAELDTLDPQTTTPDSALRPGTRPIARAAGQAVFWVVMLIGLVGAFDALRISAIARPLSNLISSFMSLLPAIGAAALIAIGGYVLAKIVRLIVTRALESLGFDRLIARARLNGLFLTSTPSRIIGWAAMALILIQTAIAALDQLSLATLSGPLSRMMGQFWELLPSLFVSVLIVVLGVFLARLIAAVVQRAMIAVGFDRLMTRIGFGQVAGRTDDLARPSGVVAFIVRVGIVLLAVVQALRNLDLDMWALYVDSFLIFAVTRVVVAIAIIVVGFTIGNYVRDLIAARQPGAQPGRPGAMADPVWLAEFARYAVLVFAFTMAVHQLGFAEQFVLVSFGLLFGGLCLAGALAFGLGSREVAGEIVRERYRRMRQPGPGPGPGSAPSPSPAFGQAMKAQTKSEL